MPSRYNDSMAFAGPLLDASLSVGFIAIAACVVIIGFFAFITIPIWGPIALIYKGGCWIRDKLKKK
jgi:hypothetical protein